MNEVATHDGPAATPSAVQSPVSGAGAATVPGVRWPLSHSLARSPHAHDRRHTISSSMGDHARRAYGRSINITLMVVQPHTQAWCHAHCACTGGSASPALEQGVVPVPATPPSVQLLQ
jgi:hypothetical protein